MSSRPKPKPVASTPFSDFIRNASAAEKKRVYRQVMKMVAEQQNALLNRKTRKLPRPT